MKSPRPGGRHPFSIALTFLLAAGTVAPASAGPGRSGWWLTFSAHGLDFKGDLARDLILWHFEKSFAVPRLGTGTGLAVGIGVKKDGGSWDVSYLRSGHTVRFEGASHAATFHSIEISGRSFLLKTSAIHPYLLGGISIPIIHVDDASAFRGDITDATYLGGGLNAGGGIVLDLGPRMTLLAGLTYRYLAFLYANGEGKGRDINNLRIGYGGPEFGRLLLAHSLTLTVGLGFVL